MRQVTCYPCMFNNNIKVGTGTNPLFLQSTILKSAQRIQSSVSKSTIFQQGCGSGHFRPDPDPPIRNFINRIRILLAVIESIQPSKKIIFNFFLRYRTCFLQLYIAREESGSDEKGPDPDPCLPVLQTHATVLHYRSPPTVLII